jgi:uncharacterized phage infection (PIP) family protein YhgE|tara:strand:- start:23870 stop:24475 length:606 start_codon:yes stop_codon:yes gene_type:complete
MNEPNTDPTPAGSPGSGAGESQPSNAEVTELQAALEASKAVVAERDSALETANTSITDLTAANKKFADDAAGLASQGKQLQEIQSALEQSRKTSTDLQTQLDAANVARTELQTQSIARRRQDLVTLYKVPADRVAEMDEAGLTVLESTLPHVPVSSPPNGNGTPASPVGMGLGEGAGATDLSNLTDSERALRTIEGLKAIK